MFSRRTTQFPGPSRATIRAAFLALLLIAFAPAPSVLLAGAGWAWGQPQLPVGSLSSQGHIASGQRALTIAYLYQDLDTPYAGSEEIANPDSRRTIQRTAVAQLDWGLGERLSARLLIPGRDITATGMVEFDSTGLGDVEAWGRWGLGPEAGRGGGAVSGGLAFPTGREGDPAVTDENIVFGAGDYSLLLSVEGFRRLTAAHTLFGLVRYRYPVGSGSNGYRFGDDFGWAATWRWNPGEGSIGLLLGASGQHLGQDELNGAGVVSRGGRLNHLTAGVSFPTGEGASIGLVGQHLIDQDMRGDQLLAQWNFVAAWSLTWGQHLHDPPSTGAD